MRHTKSDYFGAVCRRWDWRLAGADLDTWGRRGKLGFSLSVATGAARERRSDAVEGGLFTAREGPVSACLDVNPPLGEPNRLYLTVGSWHVTLGLPSIRGERARREDGAEVWESFTSWRALHVDGLSRYRYHQDGDGEWVRGGKFGPLHWGWLTVERSTRGRP